MPGQIAVTVLLFASLREAAGTDRIAITVPRGTPLGAVWGSLPEGIAPAEPPGGLRYALNGRWTPPGAALENGDEVALVLPVSGG